MHVHACLLLLCGFIYLRWGDNKQNYGFPMKRNDEYMGSQPCRCPLWLQLFVKWSLWHHHPQKFEKKRYGKYKLWDPNFARCPSCLHCEVMKVSYYNSHTGWHLHLSRHLSCNYQIKISDQKQQILTPLLHL